MDCVKALSEPNSTDIGKLFHTLITRWVKKDERVLLLLNCLYNLKRWPLL